MYLLSAPQTDEQEMVLNPTSLLEYAVFPLFQVLRGTTDMVGIGIPSQRTPEDKVGIDEVALHNGL